MLTRNQILELSEPVGEMYQKCTAQLLINIARHLGGGKAESSTQWEIEKLSQMGKLTQESVEIIANATGLRASAIADAVYAAVIHSAEENESALMDAAEKGYIRTADTDLAVSSRILQIVRDYAGQAAEQTNLVNTVMLSSVQNRYRQAIAQIVAFEEAARIEALTDAATAEQLSQKMHTAQTVLNQAAGMVNLGTSSRQQAVRQAIETLAKNGITGFVDKGGHQWSPEAYVNMDVRTTVHNTAIQAQRTRSEEYGVTTFQVSSHAGARPLCAPYQGLFFSWAGDSGTIYDGNGVAYHYDAIGDTSYGQPAGLFGINCGHFPETFISGYSYARYEPTKDEQANSKAYALSQQQRALERKVRNAKTKAAMFDAAGDREAFDKAAMSVKKASADYKAFCEANGRTARMDRTQVYGYNRSVSGKATAAYKRDLHQVYKGYLGTQAPAATAAKLKAITDNGDKWLLDGFVKAVDKGDIHVLVGIDVYIAIAKEIEKKLIGIVTATGVKIESYSTHFVDRVIGQTKDSHKIPEQLKQDGRPKYTRQGVSITDVYWALVSPVEASSPTSYKDGDIRQTLYGKKAQVTFSIREKKLIQSNPI